jgi:predicted MFS family arabinose efflux permease
MAAAEDTAGTAETPRNLSLVVGAAAAGTIFEWYDFYIYGSILAIISRQFFGGVNETAAYVFTLLGFGAGFIARPFGALVFGRIGDRLGRKRAFLITIAVMGLATFAIGLLPTYAQVGILAPALLIALRLLQGFAVGGEYGGAVIYVAEHAPNGQRGYYTGWLQATASAGLVAALIVVIGTRQALGDEAFANWGWRIPFLISIGLLAISLWVRMRLQESPVFEKLRRDGALSRAPIAESFLQWQNLKYVLIALAAFMAAHAVIWYSIHFYSQVFLGRVLKVPDQMVSGLLLIAVTVSVPLYVFFGWLSDRLGRKPLMFSAMALSAALFFQLFHAMAGAANPELVAAQETAPVTVVADPASCSLQFDPVGAEQFLTSCDIAKSVLATSGVSYRNLGAPPGSLAEVHVGDAVIPGVEGRGLAPAELAPLRAGFEGRLKQALAAAGYPASANPAEIDRASIIGILLVLMVLATMLYGPLAATLVELFPSRIRYTALSVPYHVGNGWFGGFLPAVATATVATTGDIYSGFWYVVIIAGASAVFALFFLPETSGRDIARM